MMGNPKRRKGGKRKRGNKGHTIRVLGDPAVVVNGVDVSLLRNQEAEAAASRVLEADAAGLVAENALDVGPLVQLVVKAVRDEKFAIGIPILRNIS